MHTPEVIVVGAGLAGLTCAWKLARRGRKVVLVEAQPYVGGRTASWCLDGMMVESGLHKFLGIYRELPNLLREAGLGLDSVVEWVDRMDVVSPDGGPTGSFPVSPYRTPARTLGGLLGNNDFLPPSDKAKLAAMGAAGLLRYLRRPLDLDEVSIDAWAARCGVSAETRTRFLQALTAGVFFVPAQEYSIFASFAPLWEGIKRGLTMRIGAFRGGMTEVMAGPLAAALERAGVEIRLGTPVEALLVEEGTVVGVRLPDGPLRARHVVLAASLGKAQSLLREHFSHAGWCRGLMALRSVPVVTVQMELDSPALPGDYTNFSAGTAVCCYAEQSRTTFRSLPGRLSAILYPPEQLLNLPDQEVFDRTLADAKRLGMDLRGRVKQYRVVSHPQDFYRIEVGAEKHRPAQETPVMGLSLAGDYTRQPFLASMEGAAISGRLAAEAAERAMGMGRARAHPQAVPTTATGLCTLTPIRDS